MGTLHLVRHGQASFGAADYDQLSPLGERQCEALGRWYAARGLGFSAVLCGTLRRHRQSLAAFTTGFGALPEAHEWPALNEYDSEALVRAVHPGPLARPDTPEAYRAHFRLLRQALLAWTAGEIAPPGLPRHADWRAGIAAVLEHVRTQAEGEVLLFSSGGPIATATSLVLGTPDEAWIELNLRLRNSAVTEFAFTPRRHTLHSFNTLPHLAEAAQRDWITYA
jgi:broad specificity phosphatase PhoE